MGKLFVVKVLFAGALVAGVAGPAHAHADVSAECWAHLGGVQTAKTPGADRRYHLERGEPSPCTEQDAQPQSHENERERPANENKHEDNDRFCIGRCNDKWWRND